MIRRTLSCARNEISFLPSRKPQMLFVFSTKPSIFCINKVWPTPGLIVLLVISEISCCYLLKRNLWKLEKWVASRCKLLQPAAVGENMSLSIPSNLIQSTVIQSHPNQSHDSVALSPRHLCPIQERRIDPEDGFAYTWDELVEPGTGILGMVLSGIDHQATYHQ